MKKATKSILLTLLAVAVVVAVAIDALSRNHNTFQKSRVLMGTVVTFTVDEKNDADAEKSAKTVFDEIEKLENCISKNKTGTPISVLNQNGEVEKKELIEYINECEKISQLSDGAFDITVGSISNLWNFDSEQTTVPDGSLINQALETVGYSKIKLDKGMVSVPAGTILDFGAAGKGMACDAVLNSLTGLNTKNAVIAVGGSVGVYGKKAVVGIRDPFGKTNESFATINFAGAVASTSGVYEKNFKVDGVNYHHILDPTTGYPVQNDIVSVTVIAKNGLASDALATACFKLGFDGSNKILNQYDAMAVFVYGDKKVKTINEKYDFKIIDDAYEK